MLFLYNKYKKLNIYKILLAFLICGFGHPDIGNFTFLLTFTPVYDVTIVRIPTIYLADPNQREIGERKTEIMMRRDRDTESSFSLFLFSL